MADGGGGGDFSAPSSTEEVDDDCRFVSPSITGAGATFTPLSTSGRNGAVRAGFRVSRSSTTATDGAVITADITCAPVRDVSYTTSLTRRRRPSATAVSCAGTAYNTAGAAVERYRITTGWPAASDATAEARTHRPVNRKRRAQINGTLAPGSIPLRKSSAVIRAPDATVLIAQNAAAGRWLTTPSHVRPVHDRSGAPRSAISASLSWRTSSARTRW